jgi:hypothetical protein
VGHHISSQQWESYDQLGYLKLGKSLNPTDLAALCQRIDDIMLGKASLDYNRILMQLDSETGKYEDAGQQTRGHKGATLGYRKIQDLELDPLFYEYLTRSIFKEICDHVYGPTTPVAAFRAMFMNKPARKGTFLPWHQDRWTFLDRDPLITLWTALDPATVANGCVQVIPASHRLGLINPSHSAGFLTPEQANQICTPDKVVYLELEPGESVLLHNYLLHASDVNKTDIARRAFSVCYMDARTIAQSGDKFSAIFENGAPELQGSAR